jgi:hypothetical protein
MCVSCVVILFWISVSCALAQETGFKIDRYAHLWERNPFAPVTQAAPQARHSIVDKLFLASWLKDGGREVIFVQNSETNELQRVTVEPNQNNLRLIETHLNPISQLMEAMISDGKEQGTVKFMFDVQSPAGQSALATVQVRNNGVTGKTPKSGEVALQASKRWPANLPGVQTPGFPVTAPANQLPTSRFHPGLLRVRKEGDPG